VHPSKLEALFTYYNNINSVLGRCSILAEIVICMSTLFLKYTVKSLDGLEYLSA
jgi:hypothetical protein